MAIPATKLVADAMKAVGCEGKPTEFVDKLKIGGRHSPQKVSRWLSGKHEPDYEATMLLLETAGMLREAGEAAGEEQSSVGPLESLAEAVASMIRTNQDLADRVADVENELRSLDAERQPKRSGKTRPATGRR